MLSVHPLPSIVPEAHCPRIPKLREDNVVEHHHARITKESQSAVPDLATALEGRFVGNCGKRFSIRRAGRKEEPRSLSPAIPAWRHQMNTFELFFNTPEPVIWKPRFRRPMFTLFSCTVTQIHLLQVWPRIFRSFCSRSNYQLYTSIQIKKVFFTAKFSTSECTSGIGRFATVDVVRSTTLS